ncbi:hypothetical protein ACFL6S_15595 [Candidatus Poribacteria bacterium]
MTMIAYQKMRRLLWIGILISLSSCAESDTEDVTEDARYDWTWGHDGVWVLGNFMGKHLDFIGYSLGCSFPGEIEATSHEVKFSCGYRVQEALPLQAKHYDGRSNGSIDDGDLDSFSLTGVVLIAFATRSQLDRNSPEPGAVYSISISDILRDAKTAAEIEKPEEVFFEDLSLAVDDPDCPEYIEYCWNEVNADFILCWDSIRTGQRAYQLICPTFSSVPSDYRSTLSGCETFVHPHLSSRRIQGLGVYWPLLDRYVQDNYVTETALFPDIMMENLKDFIDEALPRRRLFR